MPATQEKQTCSKCRESLPLGAFRRGSHRSNGRDTICRKCRKAAYHKAKSESFGPLPEPEGSRAWVEEIWRRAKLVKREKERERRG